MKPEGGWPCAQCSSSQSAPASAAASVAATNCARTSSMSARVIARAVWLMPCRDCSREAAVRGQVDAVGGARGGGFGAGVAQLYCEAGVGVVVNPVGNALEGRRVRAVVQARAAGG